MTHEDWMHAARTAWLAWDRFIDDKTPLGQARALTDLNDAMHDLVTWLPDWDYESGRLVGDDQ